LIVLPNINRRKVIFYGRYIKNLGLYMGSRPFAPISMPRVGLGVSSTVAARKFLLATPQRAKSVSINRDTL
jgi:hypothetical protein